MAEHDTGAGRIRSGRRADAVRLSAEAWVCELPRDVDKQAALPQAADSVWQTTLTAESSVIALLLPMAALPSLLAEHPQVSKTSLPHLTTPYSLKVMFHEYLTQRRLNWASGLHWLQGRPALTGWLPCKVRRSKTLLLCCLYNALFCLCKCSDEGAELQLL